MEKKHVNIRVSGRVQGVFFRASTQGEARRLGINGFVRNEFDGSVYIEAEGLEPQVDQFIQWCRLGPPHAAVKTIRVRDGDLESFEEFRVRY